MEAWFAAWTPVFQSNDHGFLYGDGRLRAFAFYAGNIFRPGGASHPTICVRKALGFTLPVDYDGLKADVLEPFELMA